MIRVYSQKAWLCAKNAYVAVSQQQKTRHAVHVASSVCASVVEVPVSANRVAGPVSVTIAEESAVLVTHKVSAKRVMDTEFSNQLSEGKSL